MLRFLDVSEALATSRSHAPPRGGRILLLGPDDEHRRQLHVMLDHRGYDVAALCEVDAAMRWLTERDCRAIIAPAAIAAAVQQHQPRSPVIAVVASRDLAPSLAALDAGAADVMREPVDETQLALALMFLFRGMALDVASFPLPFRPVQQRGSPMKTITRHRAIALRNNRFGSVLSARESQKDQADEKVPSDRAGRRASGFGRRGLCARKSCAW